MSHQRIAIAIYCIVDSSSENLSITVALETMKNLTVLD